MSNSPLVNYTKISPNKNSPRNQKIDTITIHCAAGNVSVETLGSIFAPTSRQASSNYGVGTDGRIGLYCDENDRSWCTGSPSNDHRAVTIEVANDGGAPDWHVSDAALASLIKLVADICKRNDIKKLLWKGDKSLIGQVDKQNMTVHRWFAAKACPGDYLYNKHGYIADEVNKLLGAPCDAQSTDAVIWTFLKSKGLNDYAAAGIMGNLYAESNLRPNNLQNSFEKSLSTTDELYTKNVDSGAYTNFVNDKAGYGLAQWTFWSRKEALLKYAKDTKKSIGDLAMQLEFLWLELQAFKGLIVKLNQATTIKAASDLVLTDYEAPADQSDTVKNKRSDYSNMFFDKFADRTIATIPTIFKEYLLRSAVTALNIRKGPGTNYEISKFLMNDNNVYTVVAEEPGPGAKMWCKLKSEAGWIAKDYVSVISSK